MTIRTLMLSVSLALVAVPCGAQASPDPLFRASMVAAMAAHGADLATTEHCLGAQRCRELNPFLLRFNQPAVFGAVKMGLAAAQLWGVAKLHDRWPRVAVIVNVTTTVVFSAVAAHNAKIGS